MAGIFNLTGSNAVQIGATFALTFRWLDANGPVNLTGRTARMQWRKTVKASEIIADFSSEIGNIVLGGAAGTVVASLTADQTALISAKSGVYDLEIEAADGTVVNFIGGEIEFLPEVTREVTL